MECRSFQVKQYEITKHHEPIPARNREILDTNTRGAFSVEAQNFRLSCLPKLPVVYRRSRPQTSLTAQPFLFLDIHHATTILCLSSIPQRLARQDLRTSHTSRYPVWNRLHLSRAAFRIGARLIHAFYFIVTQNLGPRIR